MTLEEKSFFILVDSHAKDKHQCRLTEFFLPSGRDAYILCFRPFNADAAHPADCRYINFPVAEISRVSALNALTATVKQSLDDELRTLTNNI
jgi:hypothetical protein